MRRRALAAFLLSLAAAPADAAPLVVEIDGVRSNRGMIDVAVFGEAGRAKWPDGDFAQYKMRAPAQPGVTVVTLPDLPPATYALVLFHDENGNGTLDQNFIGIPLEGYAFSNNVRPLLSAPSFAAAAFALPAEGATLRLRIVY